MIHSIYTMVFPRVKWYYFAQLIILIDVKKDGKWAVESSWQSEHLLFVLVAAQQKSTKGNPPTHLNSIMLGVSCRLQLCKPEKNAISYIHMDSNETWITQENYNKDKLYYQQ
jgi:hypothetical protein